MKTKLTILLALLSTALFAAEPSRATLEKFRDGKVPVFGKYVMVKLPIKTGVKIWNPTALAKDSKGRIWVSNYVGEIYSLHDKDGDGLEDHAELFCNVNDDKQWNPTSMVWKGDELLVGTVKEIRAYKDTDGDLKADESRVFFKDIPAKGHLFDWTMGMELGPDGHIYVIFSTDTQGAEDPKKFRGSIVKIAPDGKSAEVFASGSRYAYGMTFNQHGDLFFTDNKGGGNPVEELNFAEKGKFYGHDTTKFPNREAIQALAKVQYGFGAGGLEFNALTNDFGGTAGNLFMACWGPDGRFDRGSLVRFELTKKDDGSYDSKEYLVAGEFAKIIDAKFADNGDLYIAQFGKEGPSHRAGSKPYGHIYRMVYRDWAVPSPVLSKMPLLAGDKVKGKTIFASRCAMCHFGEKQVKEIKGMIGPSLANIGDMFNKEEILRDIIEPSAGIKTDFEGYEIIKKDGSIIVGRIRWMQRKLVHMTIMGNTRIALKKSEIASQKMMEKSIMPEGLLGGLSEKDITDLLTYLKVRDTSTN